MKKRVLKILTIAAIIAALTIGTAQATGFFDFSKRSQTVTISQEENDRLKRFEKLDTMLQFVESYYWQEPDVDAMIENAARGLMYGLEDPYSFYYNEEEWLEMKEDDEGEYGGIGIQMLGNPDDLTVTIIRVFTGGPAEAAGVLKGDKLVRVEDVEVNMYTMQDAVNIMRGENGGEVEIEVKRGEEYITFTMTRQIIHVNRVESAMLEDSVGYIALYEFAGDCANEFEKAFKALRDQGAKALVVDLRDNGGGWVLDAKSIADLFVDKGVLVYCEDRYGYKELYETTDGKDDIPLVFLVNGNTASSSEILSGGLQDQGRAKVVGTKTFGKGIVQSVIPWDNDTWGFQLTVAQYFFSSGTPVHTIGITPDVIVEMPEEMENAYLQLGDLSDPQLKTAWETAKDMIGQ